MADLARSVRHNVIRCFLIASIDLITRAMQLSMEESSDDEDIQQAIFIVRRQMKRRKRRKVIRIKGYVDNVVSKYHTQQFRRHFRITPSAFEALENKLGNTLSGKVNEGRQCIPVRKQLLSVLWLLATPDSYRSVAEKFDMGKSSLHDSFRRVVEGLNEIADNIAWPKGYKLLRTKQKFREISPLPDIIGAIDGTHIPIKAPKVNAHYYKTRKKEFALSLQAVCDADLMFIDCFVGFAGSVHDCRVFRRSDLYNAVQQTKIAFFPQQEYIVGDKAYPVLSWCMSPYKDRGNLTQTQKQFNMHLSKSRQVIERAFALLKGRFRRLKYLDMSCGDIIPHVILACCVLHNICLKKQDEEHTDFIEEGMQVTEFAPGNDIDMSDDNIEESQEGITKRNYLLQLL